MHKLIHTKNTQNNSYSCIQYVYIKKYLNAPIHILYLYNPYSTLYIHTHTYKKRQYVQGANDTCNGVYGVYGVKIFCF